MLKKQFKPQFLSFTTEIRLNKDLLALIENKTDFYGPLPQKKPNSIAMKIDNPKEPEDF